MKSDLDFLLPGKWMNAAGTCGYMPAKGFLENFPEVALFITNPISYYPRKPAEDRNIIPFKGGFLVHSGHPNPGIKKILQLNKKAWENAHLPICLNLLSDTTESLEKIIRMVEEIDNIAAIELAFDFPLSHEITKIMIQAISGQLPIILSLPFEMVFQDWIEDILSTDIYAISIQAPRGVISHKNQLISGRLYGRSILPMTMQAVKYLSSFGIPIYAGVGVFKKEEIISLLGLGVRNFQAHEIIWRNNI